MVVSVVMGWSMAGCLRETVESHPFFLGEKPGNFGGKIRVLVGEVSLGELGWLVAGGFSCVLSRSNAMFLLY